MSASDSNNDAPSDKGKMKNPLIGSGPYHVEEVISRFGISERTFQKWRDAGLPAYKPGTKSHIIFGEDVWEVIRRFPVDPQSTEPME